MSNRALAADPTPTPDPLGIWQAAPWTDVELASFKCGTGSTCFGWKALVYDEGQTQISCTDLDGNVITGPTHYDMITIPQVKERVGILVENGTYVAVHRSWSLPGCTQPGVWCNRLFNAADIENQCVSSVNRYPIGLCRAITLLSPGSYEIGCMTTQIPRSLLCAISPDGTEAGAAAQWSNKLIDVRVCLEVVDEAYVHAFIARK